MEPPILAALIASGVAITTNVASWIVAARLNVRTAVSNHEQWRRGTRSDAYADLVIALQKQIDIFWDTSLAEALSENSDEYVTPAMLEAHRELRLKATAVRFKGPDSMRDLSIESETTGSHLLSVWQKIIPGDSSVELEEELSRAQLLVERIIREAESILGPGGELARMP